MNMRMIAGASAALIFGIAVVAVNGQQQNGTPFPSTLADRIADTATAQITDLDIVVNATGNVRPIREAALTFGAVNVVKEVFVEEGQFVHAGDVLATLDGADLDIALRDAEITLEQQRVQLEDLETPARDIDRQLVEADIQVAQAEASAAYDDMPSDEDLQIAQLRIESARNQVWQNQLQRDMVLQTNPEFRGTDINDPDSQETQLLNQIEQAEMGTTIAETDYVRDLNTTPNLSELGSAQASQVQAQVTLDNLSSSEPRDLNIAALSVESSSLAVEDLREQTDDLKIIAPYDGIITAMNLSVGELPPNGAALMIADTSTYLVELDVDEADVVEMNVGQPATIALDALPGETVSGTLRYIAPTESPNTQVPTYTVKVTLDSTDVPVRLDMNATAQVAVTRLTDVLAVPDRFIKTEGFGASVTVIGANDQLVSLPVTVGRRGDGMTQIIAGLQAGQVVVLPVSIQ